MANSSGDKKFFDVSKPGKSPADASGRPVIVSNRPMIKDPTLKPEAAKEEVPDDKKAEDSEPITSRAKTIVPLDDSISKDTKETEDKPPAKDVQETKDTLPATPAKEEDPKPDDKTSEPKKSNEEGSSEKNSPKNDDEQVDLTRAGQQKASELSEAEKVRKAKVDSLIASGKYVVPIGHIKRNRKLRRDLMVVALVLVIGLVAADLLVDAKVINTNIKPPIDLIKN